MIGKEGWGELTADFVKDRGCSGIRVETAAESANFRIHGGSEGGGVRNGSSSLLVDPKGARKVSSQRRGDAVMQETGREAAPIADGRGDFSAPSLDADRTHI